MSRYWVKFLGVKAGVMGETEGKMIVEPITENDVSEVSAIEFELALLDVIRARGTEQLQKAKTRAQ